jgi:ectoine hydroxylase-related dioxygenase (phytanoyl-CoA dioxygenase family)
MPSLVSKQENLTTAGTRYARDGFFIGPPVVPSELVRRVIPHIDAVLEGKYETGREPVRRWNPGDSPTKIRKINDTHISDRTIFEFVTHPEIGRWAAAVTGAEMVQAWASQLLFKPAGGDIAGQVGWHQDYMYWKELWEPGGELFTAWVAVSDVKAESGPMCFVRGSHRWGFLNSGDFFNSDRDRTRDEIQVPSGETWSEVPAVLPPGALSFHQCLTYHASGRNISQSPRISFALHLRTEKSKPVAGCRDHYITNLEDPQVAPVIYRAAG